MINRLFFGKGVDRVISLCCFCALLGALVMGAFDYIWYHFGNFTLFFILCAWSASVPLEQEELM